MSNDPLFSPNRLGARALRDAENQYADALAAANIARADLGRAIATSLDSAGSGGSHGR